jgi:TP901 family phage tail tape measure protein
LADVNANIGINFDTSQALAQLRQLQAGLSTFNQTLTQGNVAAMNAQKGLNSQLMQAINATGKFVATQKDVATSTSSFTQALEKNQLSMRQYFRYTAAAATQNTKVFKGMFAQERETLTRASKDRVKLLQSQYIQLQAANGDMIKTLQVIPKHLKMVNGQYTDYATRMQMAAQRQQFLNQLLKQGSTQLLNFGKNTQWAGRQLMVGLTIPLSILGSTAAKTFLEMEQSVLKFQRVYGDLTTSGDATNKALKDIQMLGKEFTKYGIAVKDTVEMAATAAAMGLTGGALNAQVIAATKLAVLGQVEQQQALETTISLQNAFGISSEQLAQKINFLNAVENQTVLSIEDLTVAIPKAGPVVKQLGGSVEDLAFFMTAMKEGGINASEGANALKSGLASMINPAKKTSEFLASLGINIKGIVNANAGDLKGTVVGFARALDTLDPLNRARAIEQLFGKFQFARLSTLFQNVTKDSSQAARALGLAGASVEELAILSERELAKVEDSTGAKFKKAMENIKNELVPVGKAFLEAVTPIVSSVGKILEKFNGLSDGTKKVITIMIGVIGGLAPIALMTFGILMNGVANAIKLFAKLRGGIAQLNGSNNVLGGGFEYLTNQQIENLAETNALHTSHNQLISTFNVEQASVNALAAAYGNAASQARALAQSSPGLFNTVPGPAGAVAGLPPTKFATGGVVPGTGNKDTVPALLTPGEVVITKDTAKANPELVAALQNNSVKRYAQGTPKSPFSKDTIDKLFEELGLNQETDRLRMPVGVLEKRYSAAGNLAPKEVNHGKNAAGEMGQDPDYLQSEFGRDSMDENIRVPLEKAGVSAERASEVLKTLESTLDEMVLAYDGTTSSWQAASDKALKAIEERTDLTNKEKEIIRQRIAPKKAEDFIIPSNPVVDVKPGRNGKPGEATMRDERTTEAYFAAEQKKRLKAKYPELSDDIDSMEFSHYPGTESMYGGRSTVESPVVNRTTTGPDGKTKKERVPLSEEQLAIIGKKQVEVEDYRIPKQEAEIAAKAPKIEVTEEDKAKAEAEGAKVGQAAIDGASGPEGADNNSPSKKGRKIGKDIADGIVEGLQEGTPEVTAQSSRLGSSAVPTAAETQAKVDKMDLDNAAFYADLDTPELRDTRQVLKSQDRQRRKRGATGRVGGGSGTPPSSGPSSVTVSSTARTEAAAEDLAVSTEQAATAQSQVVQQIRDQSKSRVTIKGNTVNIGKAREEADRLDKEASEAEAAAARVRTEAAKWEEVAAREGGKNIYTAENAKALKKLADEAEIKAAEARIKAAEAEARAVQLQNGTVEDGDGLRRIVDSTDDTVESTVLVADQTDELAVVTGDALDAQTQTATNLLTGAQITDATTLNMDDVLQATDQTGIAQQDLAESSTNIANTNELIEKEKKEELERLKRYNAQQAAAQAAENGILPGGSQSQNGVINPATAMGSVEAYEEASTYTKDKNGQLLFDPETGQPTTLTESQLKKKKRGMRKEKVGKVSGKISGGLGMATMVAGAVGAPPQVTAALGGAATVAQFAPMLAGLTGPQGIVAAVVAVGASLYLLNRHFTASARAQAKFVKDITATTDRMKKIGEFTGKVGASEQMAKRAENGFSNEFIPRERQGQEFGITFAEGEIGKQMASSFVTSMDKFGSKEAAKIFGLELAAYVADGVLTADQAQSIAFAIGSKFKDQNVIIDVEAQLSSIIGMNGNDLTRDPLKVRLDLITESDKQVQREIDAMNDKVNNTTVSGADEAARVAAFQVNALAMAQLAADSMAKYYEDEQKVLEAQLAQTTNKEEQIKIQTKLNKLIQDSADASDIANNEVLKQINNSIQQFNSNIQTSSTFMFNDRARRENAYFDSLKQSVTSAYAGTGMEKDAQTVLSRTSKISDEAASQGFKKDEVTGLSAADQGQNLEVKINMLVANKLISPMQANTFLDLFEGKLDQLELALDLGIQTRGAAKTADFLSIMSRFTDKSTASRVAVNIIAEDNNTFELFTNILGLASQLDGKEINMDIMFGGTKGEAYLYVVAEQMKAFQLELDKLAKGEPITKEFLLKFDQENGTSFANADLPFIQDQFKDDAKGQANALRAYELIYTQVNNLKFDSPEAKKMFDEEAMTNTLEAFKNRKDKTVKWEQFYAEEYESQLKIVTTNFQQDKDGFIALRFRNYIEKPGTVDSLSGDGTPKETGGEKKNPLDFLDDLAMRIKNVRDGAFDATKPLESMLAAFSNPKVKKDMSTAFAMFDGLQQRLIGLKVPKEFRDMINSMSSEDFKELAKLTGKKAIFTFQKDKKGKELPRTKANISGLTDTGKKLMKTYNEAIVGEANVVNREAVEQVANQEKAFKILVAGGASATEALQHVQDAATAAAIASGALGKVGSPERKQYIADLKKATDETERFALSQKMITANEEFKLLEQMPKLSTAMEVAGFTADQMAAVLNDPALARHLIEDLKDGKVKAGEIADYLNSIEAKKILDIQVKFNAKQYSESAKPGMEIVDEMFAVGESLLRTGADPRTTKMVETMKANEKSIRDAEASAAVFRRQIELINREIEKDQRAIEEKYSRPIEDLSEQVNDLTRELEVNPIFGDRAMEKLNTENSKLSNDLALMSNAAEKINERYDEQAEALQKVSDINEGILSQQRGQLDLADALSKGDISAAAQAMQANRADSAGRLQTSASDALEQARKNEIDGLRGAESGLSQKQIEDRQFEISQQLYKMETDPARIAILDQIRVKQDEIYRLEELREGALLKIRDKEDLIYKIQKDQLGPLEDKIEDLTYANTLIQAQIDKLVFEQTVLDQTRDKWDTIKAKIDANALASKNLDKELGALLASVDAIDKKWQSILDKMAAYSKTPVTVTTAKKEVEDKAAADAKKVAEEKKAIDDAAIAAMDKAMKGKDDGLTSSLGFNNGNSFSGDGEKGSTADAQAKADALAKLNWISWDRDASGGLIKPRRFAIGGPVIGTDIIPAMLTPGEFVMSKYAVQSTGVEKMKAINNGSSVGDAVYNYNLSVNVKSDANPEDIARVVMTQIKGVDAQRLRGSRF